LIAILGTAENPVGAGLAREGGGKVNMFIA
jgi:hypothetical protein